MAKVVCVSPFAPLEVNVQGRWLTVGRDAVVDVPAEVAGRVPSAAWLQAQVDLYAAEHAVPRSHEECARLRALVIDSDPGAGLLAQPENWQPAPKEAKP